MVENYSIVECKNYSYELKKNVYDQNNVVWVPLNCG